MKQDATVGGFYVDQGFLIKFRRSVGNLHIKLSGEFSSRCAWELIKIIKLQHSGVGRIFVNTAGLDRIASVGAELFKFHMRKSKMPSSRLYFKGEKGFEIAFDGSRVIVRNNLGNREAISFQGPHTISQAIRRRKGLFRRIDDSKEENHEKSSDYLRKHNW